MLSTLTVLKVSTQPTYIILKANLHTHTTVSDGEYTPQQVINLYADRNYDVLAITDHHTREAYPQTKDYAANRGILLVPGEEVTAQWYDKQFKHIVALFTTHTLGLTGDKPVDYLFSKIHEKVQSES